MKILEGTEDECLPLYLRIRDPSCIPILSYNSITNNVLLKITVPKRTGRKRKRGSHDPYTDDGQARATAISGQESANNIQSHSRNDKPASILRKMRDNVDKYTVEAVGAIEQSHRYRGIYIAEDTIRTILSLFRSFRIPSIYFFCTVHVTFPRNCIFWKL